MLFAECDFMNLWKWLMPKRNVHHLIRKGSSIFIFNYETFIIIAQLFIYNISYLHNDFIEITSIKIITIYNSNLEIIRILGLNYLTNQWKFGLMLNSLSEDLGCLEWAVKRDGLNICWVAPQSAIENIARITKLILKWKTLHNRNSK